MEFTVWSESNQTDKNHGSDNHGVYDAGNFADSMGSKFGPLMDRSDVLKPKAPLDQADYDLDNGYHEQDGDLATWALLSPGIPSGLPQDNHNFPWEDDFHNLAQNGSIDGDVTGSTSPFGTEEISKDLFNGDTLSSLKAIDTTRHRPSNHKRDISDTYTMRVPLVGRTHNDGYDDTGLGTADSNVSPELPANIMQTPVRGSGYNGAGHAHANDGLVNDSPSYLVNGLDSPLESPALQSPYLAYQPFPMLPTASSGTGGNSSSSSTLMRKLSSAGSPKSRRKSSSASQSSIASPLACEPVDSKQTESAPQTPRTRSAGISKSKHKRGQSSLSLSSKLPQSLTTEGASSNVSDFTTTPSAAKPTTPLRNTDQTKNPTNTVENTPTQTPTPAREGKKDGRKRIAKEQIDILEAFFHRNPRPEREDRLRLAAETHLEQRTVQIWFQNRRAKSRSMKLPPSKADTSIPAMQYRAAAAAASNAAGSASSGFGQKPVNMSPGVDYDYWGPNGGPQLQRQHSVGGFSRPPSMSQMSPINGGAMNNNGGGFQMAQQYPPHHQRWHSVSSPSPSSQPMTRYHQQLPKQGVSQTHGMAAQMQRIQQFQQMEQMQHMQQLQQAQQMQRIQQSQQYQQQPFRTMHPGMPRSNSSSMFEPHMTYGGQLHPDSDFNSNDMAMMSNAPSRSESMLSLASLNSAAVPRSPLTGGDNMAAFSPDMRSSQNSPELISPFPWPSTVSRNSSSATLHGGNNGSFDYPGQISANDIKRRRSLYGNSAPIWNSQYEGDSLNSSRVSPTNAANGPGGMPNGPAGSVSGSGSNSGSSSGSGSVAASAAAAALRTRHRSYTQPVTRSRQPSIRLQLDESNNAAQLVVLPDDQYDNDRGSFSGRQGSSFRDTSPGRAERAAERLLAERAAAATMNRVPSHMSKNE